jgi:hypothetical protein
VTVHNVLGALRLAAYSLPLRLDLANHSPTGFEWGYAGSGPSQLALALLADALVDDKAALSLHMVFKFHTVAHFPRATWDLSLHQVLAAAVEIAKPCGLMRDGARISRICGDCASFLRERHMVIPDDAGVLDPAPGYTAEQTRAAAFAHHGSRS